LRYLNEDGSHENPGLRECLADDIGRVQAWHDALMPEIDDTTARKLALGTAAGRVGFGLAMLTLPVLTLRVFGVKQVPGPLLWLARVFGIRDVVLGVGTLAALRRNDGSAAQWVGFAAMADGADAVLAIVKPTELGRARSYVGAAIALSAAIPGALAARALAAAR
jgi:hypothetical protein